MLCGASGPLFHDQGRRTNIADRQPIDESIELSAVAAEGPGGSTGTTTKYARRVASMSKSFTAAELPGPVNNIEPVGPSWRKTLNIGIFSLAS